MKYNLPQTSKGSRNKFLIREHGSCTPPLTYVIRSNKCCVGGSQYNACWFVNQQLTTNLIWVAKDYRYRNISSVIESLSIQKNQVKSKSKIKMLSTVDISGRNKAQYLNLFNEFFIWININLFITGQMTSSRVSKNRSLSFCIKIKRLIH